jgi:PIN domain nuclease of toxin-antitoxin system
VDQALKEMSAERERSQMLAISGEHAIRADLLPGAPKDPFDCMLIDQTQAGEWKYADCEQ